MTLGTLLTLAALVLTDPTGDAAGDGTLTAPSAPIYANASIFDVQEVELEGDDAGATLRVTMGSLDNASSLPEGFSGVIVDVYVDTEPGGATVTLPGPNMRMPPGRGWQFAVRISGDGAYAVRYAEMTEGVDALDPGEAASVGNAGAAQADAEQTMEPESALDALGRVPLAIARDGSTLSVRIPWPVGEHPEVYAMSGVYDPFTPTGWRPLAAAPSPWAFSGTDQVVPVVDLLAPDADAQEHALRTAVLPRMLSRSALASPWLLVMAAGLAVAALGLWLRRKVAPEGAVATPEPVADAAAEVVPEVVPEVATDGAAEIAPEVVPEIATEATPDGAAEIAPDVTPEMATGATLEVDEGEVADARPVSGSVALALRSDVPSFGADATVVGSAVADAAPPEPAATSAVPDAGPPDGGRTRHDPFAAFGGGEDEDDEPETDLAAGFAKPSRPRAAPGSHPADVEEDSVDQAEPQDDAATDVVEHERSGIDAAPDADRHGS